MSAADANGEKLATASSASGARLFTNVIGSFPLQVLIQKSNRVHERVVGGMRAEILREAVIGVRIGNEFHGSTQRFRQIIKLLAAFDRFARIGFAVHDQ